MKKSCILYLTVLLAAGSIYVLNGSYAMLLSVFVLLTGLPGGAIVGAAGGRKLKLTWEFLDEPEEEKAVFSSLQPGTGQEAAGRTGMVRIKNESWVPVLHGELLFSWENSLTGEQGQQKQPFAVLPRGKTEVKVRLHSRSCGVYHIRVSMLQVFDLFWMFCFRRKMEAQAEFQVEPTTALVHIPILQSDRYDMESFRYAEAKSGDDSTETFDLREYAPGDSIRKIHWKLTGKMGTVMIRESSYPVFNSVLLLLETGYQPGKRPSPERMDAAVSVFLSTAELIAGLGLTFGIGFFDYEKESFCLLRPQKPEEVWNILPELLRAQSAQSEISACTQYQLQHGEQRYAQYIYVTAGESYEEAGTEADRFHMEAAADILVLRCAETYGQSKNEIRFTVNNWKEELME